MATGQRARGELLEISPEHREIETGQPRDLVARSEQVPGEALEVELPDRHHAPFAGGRVDALGALGLAFELLEDDLDRPEKARHPFREERSPFDELVDLGEHVLKIAGQPFHVVRALNAEQHGAIDGALEEPDRREREMRSVAPGQKSELRDAERSPQVLDVARALIRVVGSQVDAAPRPELPALGGALPKSGENQVAFHGLIEREIEPARTIQSRLRASHPPLIQGDDVGELRDLEEEREDLTFRVVGAGASRAAGEPDHRRSRPGRGGSNPQERELDRRTRRAGVILGNGEPAELRGDAGRAVPRLEQERGGSDPAGDGGRDGR